MIKRQKINRNTICIVRCIAWFIHEYAICAKMPTEGKQMLRITCICS